MKINYIYLFIGFSTLILNIALTFHIIKKCTGTYSRGSHSCDDVITFRLSRENNAEGITTEALPCDDTIPLNKNNVQRGDEA
ncbi:MAG TPA: hypothetical protein PLL98_04640 [Bacillota bacterium]|nr:hypothetical protein [Bacillota bacterium]HPL54088.1 hypothetical protein [Bacillota bacterium]